MNDDLITYMDHLWLKIDDSVITVGLNETGVEELDEFSVELPEEGAIVVPGEVCGELVTEQGSINLYAPLDGHIVEINEAVVDDPQLVKEDCYEDGWIYKMEVDNIEDLRDLEDELETDDE